jgi:hypothetical protein
VVKLLSKLNESSDHRAEIRSKGAEKRRKASTPQGNKTMEELVRYLKALVALQLRSEREDGAPTPKIEVILAGLKFTAKEIAELSGKSQAAVAKAISRGKAALKTGALEESKEVPNAE